MIDDNGPLIIYIEVIYTETPIVGPMVEGLVIIYCHISFLGVDEGPDLHAFTL